MSGGRKRATPRATHQPVAQDAPGVPGRPKRRRAGGGSSDAVAAYGAARQAERLAKNAERRDRARAAAVAVVEQADGPRRVLAGPLAGQLVEVLRVLPGSRGRVMVRAADGTEHSVAAPNLVEPDDERPSEVVEVVGQSVRASGSAGLPTLGGRR